MSVYIAHNRFVPLGIFTSREKADRVSTDIIEISVPDTSLASGETAYYATAAYPLLSVVNGVPMVEDTFFGPVIGRSASEVLAALAASCRPHRVSECTLDQFFRFTVDDRQHFVGNQPLTNVHSLETDLAYTSAKNLKADILIQHSWRLFRRAIHNDVDNLAFDQILDILAAAHAADSLTAPQNEYANNRVVNALVNMALANKSVYIAEERDTATWAKANIGTIGYLAFTQRDLFTGLPSDIQRKWTLRACQVNDLLNTFCSAPEYGVYFNFNAQEHEYCFLNRDIIIRAWRAVQDGV